MRPALGPALQRLQYVRIRCRNVLTKYHPGVSVPVDWEHSTIHAPKQSFCCSKGDPFQGPKLCSCLTLRNELSEETHVLTKQEILLGKGTQEHCSAVSGFMVMGLVSRLSLANHSYSEPFLVVQTCSAKMDARDDSARWSDMCCLLLTFPELFRLVAAYLFCVPYRDLLS